MITDFLHYQNTCELINRHSIIFIGTIILSSSATTNLNQSTTHNNIISSSSSSSLLLYLHSSMKANVTYISNSSSKVSSKERQTVTESLITRFIRQSYIEGIIHFIVSYYKHQKDYIYTILQPSDSCNSTNNSSNNNYNYYIDVAINNNNDNNSLEILLLNNSQKIKSIISVQDNSVASTQTQTVEIYKFIQNINIETWSNSLHNKTLSKLLLECYIIRQLIYLTITSFDFFVFAYEKY